MLEFKLAVRNPADAGSVLILPIFDLVNHLRKATSATGMSINGYAIAGVSKRAKNCAPTIGAQFVSMFVTC